MGRGPLYGQITDYIDMFSTPSLITVSNYIEKQGIILITECQTEVGSEEMITERVANPAWLVSETK